MLVLEGLLAMMADEERMGIGLSEGLFAIVLSVTVLLEDASLGVFPPRSSLLELILSSPLLPAAEHLKSHRIGHIHLGIWQAKARIRGKEA